jgi:HEAT repeat protein
MRLPAFALLLPLLCPAAFPHGGQYKGPNDAGGPAGGAGGAAGAPGAPSGAGVPGPGVPTSPGSTPGTGASGLGVGRPGGRPVTSGGYEPDGGYERWEFWWEQNKDQYLDLRNRISRVTTVSGSPGQLSGKGRPDEARSGRRPGEELVSGVVIPALTGLLASEDDRDILDSALLALGRVSGAERIDALVQAVQPLLAHRELVVQTAAALALGIPGSPRASGVLVELLANTSRGRQLAGDAEVPARLRAFAALSLGLVGDAGSQRQLMDLVRNTPDSERDLKACAIVALGLARDAGRSEGRALLLELLDDRRLDASLKSCVPTALARLAGPDGDDEALARVLAAFTDRDTDGVVRQSCAIALGLLARIDQAEALASLEDCIAEGRDAQTRHFAIIALAEIGRRDSDHVAEHPDQHRALRALFARELLKPETRSHRSWAALASAIYARSVRPAIPETGTLLAKAYARETDLSYKAACAVALGLLGYQPAAGALLEDFTQVGDQGFRGYAAVALGLLDHQPAAEPLLVLCRSRATEPAFRLQVATALGLLGEQAAVPVLVGVLQSAPTTNVSSAVAKALGLIGDVSAVEPLRAVALDRSAPAAARAFACVALGIVCERGALPWNARLRQDHNYRMRVPALEEVLDIL